MSEEGNKKLFAHYANIVDGKYSTERYSPKDIAEEINLNKVSNSLIISDAKKHLADLIKKNPSLVVEEVKEDLPKPKEKK